MAGSITREAPPDLALGRFTPIRKASFHLDQETKIEIDLHAVSEPDGTALTAEVKDWQRAMNPDSLYRFTEVKKALAGQSERKTRFLLYNESGLGEEPAATLLEAGILIGDAKTLAGHEMASSL